MDNTINNIIIFEDSEFYSLTPVGRHKLSNEEADALKPGYTLIISDTDLFYTTMEFPNAPKRKLNIFIANHLMGSFPQQLCEKFCYFSKGEKILIGIFSHNFAEHSSNFYDVFSKAAYITSPLANAYSKYDDFSYDINGLSINVAEGLISNTEQSDNAISPDWEPSPEAKLVVPFIKKRSAALDIYKIPVAVLVACYLVFIAGDYLRLKAHTDKLAKSEAALATIYKKAGVAASKDPYGKLLALAGEDSSGSSYMTLYALEKISKAHNENITTDSIEIKGNNVTFQGSSADYTFLEEFKKKLATETGKDVQILDTIKKEGSIAFTLRFDI